MKDFFNLIGWPDSPGLMVANLFFVFVLPVAVLILCFVAG